MTASDHAWVNYNREMTLEGKRCLAEVQKTIFAVLVGMKDMLIAKGNNYGND